jgi:hypothetical protein
LRFFFRGYFKRFALKVQGKISDSAKLDRFHMVCIKTLCRRCDINFSNRVYCSTAADLVNFFILM